MAIKKVGVVGGGLMGSGIAQTAAQAGYDVLMAEKDALAVVVSPSDRQSREFVRKTATCVRKLGFKVRGDGDNDVSLLLPNGSRLIGLPDNEDTVRGFSGATLLIVDEAARVSEEMYEAIRPMLAVSQGAL